MSTAPVELTDPLTQADKWMLGTEDTLTAVYVKPDGYTIEYVVPDSTLTQYHPQLPQAIRAMINWCGKDSGNTRVFRSHIQATLEVLRGAGLSFKDERGEQPYVTRITRLTSLGPTVQIWGQREVLGSEMGDYSVPYSLHSSAGVFIVEKQELEARYPGWEARWKMGEELGVSLSELTQYAFTTAVPDVRHLSAVITFE